MIDLAEFRELTRRVITAEKIGFWSDWTSAEQELYSTGNWVAFSISRGYSKEEIAEYSKWLDICIHAIENNINPYALIADLTTAAALRNIALDTRGEIMKSSHLPRRVIELVKGSSL